MVEQGLELEIYINTGTETEDQAVTQLLETLDIDALIRRTLQEVHVQQAVMLTLLVCGDAEIQALNKEHRQQDKPTDVLSFPLLDEPLVEAPTEWLWQPPEDEGTRGPRQPFVTPTELLTNLGDIIISWPTVQRQASEAGHSIGYELLFLLCHGVLHLVGYDDQTETGYQEMMRLQQTLLSFQHP